MKCDYCKKDCGKFCYSVPQGVYGNRTPWTLCSKKCMDSKVKQTKQKQKEKENAKK